MRSIRRESESVVGAGGRQAHPDLMGKYPSLRPLEGRYRVSPSVSTVCACWFCHVCVLNTHAHTQLCAQKLQFITAKQARFFFWGQSVVNSGCPRAAHDETIKLKCVFTSESSSHRLNHTMFWRKLPLSLLSFGLFLQEDFNLYNSVMWSVIHGNSRTGLI